MAMKLLSKTEVIAVKAQERLVEVQEGLKVARKVDALREAAAKEETSLELFRSETLKKIHEEIKSVTDTRDALKEEVRQLEQDKKEALKPLDAAWQEVNVAKDTANRMVEEHAKTRFALAEWTKELEQQEKGIAKERAKLMNMHILVKKALEEADTLKADTELTNNVAHTAYQKFLTERQEQKRLLTARESEVSAREKRVQRQKEKNDQRHIDLNAREKILKDRIALFERNLKRYE